MEIVHWVNGILVWVLLGVTWARYVGQQKERKARRAVEEAVAERLAAQALLLGAYDARFSACDRALSELNGALVALRAESTLYRTAAPGPTPWMPDSKTVQIERSLRELDKMIKAHPGEASFVALARHWRALLNGTSGRPADGVGQPAIGVHPHGKLELFTIDELFDALPAETSLPEEFGDVDEK